MTPIVGKGTVGNTNEGTLDGYVCGAAAAWINAGRCQAGSNMTVTTMFAKVGAISRGYKCAIYTDRSSNPSGLLGATAEVSNPANGWNVLPFTSPVSPDQWPVLLAGDLV